MNGVRGTTGPYGGKGATWIEGGASSTREWVSCGLTVEDAHHVLGSPTAEFHNRLSRREGHVRREDGFRTGHEIIRNRWFARNDIKGSTTDLPAFERFDESCIVHEGPPRGVDQEGVGLHLGEDLPSDRRPIGGRGHVQGEDVGLG